MRAAVSKDEITRIVTIAVTEVPDIDISETFHRAPRIIRPDQAILVIRDDVPRRIEVTGPIVLKSGKVSAETKGRRTWYGSSSLVTRDRVDASPEWVQELWFGVEKGHTEWPH